MTIIRHSNIAGYLAAFLISSFSFAAPLTQCPTLSKADVLAVINKGFIGTTQSHTLAYEAGKSRAEVLTEEPTANPFDTYYEFSGEYPQNQQYTIFIGSVLANNTYEAKARIRKILLRQDSFSGELVDGYCQYVKIDSPPKNNPKYPYKSKYESIIMAITADEETLSQIKQVN